MFKVTFKWLQGNPCGGESQWKTKMVFFDADSAEDLNQKVQEYIDEKSNCYRKYFNAIEAVRI